jgi:hypothetical protein
VICVLGRGMLVDRFRTVDERESGLIVSLACGGADSWDGGHTCLFLVSLLIQLLPLEAL